MKKYSLLVLFLGLALMKVDAQNFDDGFDFNLPWNDTLNSDFFPQFSTNPITDEDFVSTDEDGNFIVNGEAYRFFGGNVTARGAFPFKTQAAEIAARMRKYGVNLIRFHHIDNPWSDGSLFYNIDGTRQFHPDRLDRLDYFIYQLKKHGIYVDMNLNVSRTFELSDGVVDADSLQQYGKGITQFDPYLKKLQKEYASMLLYHTNPYTGTKLAEDPVLAMMEIINENSLFRLWYGNNLQSISKGGSLPVYYEQMLDSLWINYLSDKYTSTENIQAAWNTVGLTGDTIIYDGYEEGIGSNWSVELRETAAATAITVNDAPTGDSAVLVDVTATSTEGWHTKFKYTGASVKKDSIYEFYFKAKSDGPANISVIFQKSTSPWTYYSGLGLSIDSEYKEYKVTYKAVEDNNENLFIAFSFDNKTGHFYFDDFLFKKQSIAGLDEEESLEEKNIRRVNRDDILTVTSERLMDQTEFYTNIQLDFLHDMKTYLVDTLHVKAPITGSNWFTGPENVYVQKEMDFIDNHAYWDHPHFPNVSWDQNDWTIKNTPMLTAASGTVEGLFNGMMVKGKPYTVSEYNHAFPNQYQAELFPLITSYLSFNAADALMVFTYNGEWDYSSDFVNGYFDTNRNTSLMGSFPLFSYAFRSFLIDESESVSYVNYSYNDILRMPVDALNSYSTHYPYEQSLGYTNRLEMTFDNASDFDLTELPTIASSPYELNASQIYWDKKGLLKINTPQLASICGFLDAHPGATTDMMQVKKGSDFGAVNWLSLSDSALNESSHSILNIGTKVTNTGMIWEGTTTVHNRWGNPPVLVYPLELELELKTEFPFVSVCKLNEYGQVDSTVMVILARNAEGYVEVPINQAADKTIWYGIHGLYTDPTPIDTSTIDTTTVDTTTIDTTTIDTTGIQYAISGSKRQVCYPNPATQIVSFDPGNDFGDAELHIYDLRGRIVYWRHIYKKDEIDISAWNRGAYFYKIVADKKMVYGKFLIVE